MSPGEAGNIIAAVAGLGGTGLGAWLSYALTRHGQAEDSQAAELERARREWAAAVQTQLTHLADEVADLRSAVAGNTALLNAFIPELRRDRPDRRPS